jgi:Haem-NO-binding
MKGVVFTEFLEMVEERFSEQMADRIIENSELASGGAYTTVGTYDHGEMIQLVSRLSEETKIPADELLRSFGIHLFGRFHVMFPKYFEGISSSFDFLQMVDRYVHVEVLKLYPDAELPSFDCDASQPGCLRMTYRSSRPFAPLAEGLIRGCVGHYGEAVDIATEDMSNGTGTAARFVLTKKDAAS